MSENGDRLRNIAEGLKVAMARLTADIASAANALADLAVQLDKSVEPPTPSTPTTIGRSSVWLTPDLPPQAEKYDALVLQRSATDEHVGHLATSKRALAFMTPIARRFSDVAGYSVALPADQVKWEWLYPGQITRDHKGKPETFINPGHAGYVNEVGRTLPAKLQTGGYDGVLIDEVDMYPTWSFPNSLGKVSENLHRENQLAFLRGLKANLAAADLELWVNLGANNDVNDRWINQVLGIVDGIWYEQFIGRAISGYAAPATVNDMWREQTGFIQYASSKVMTMVNVAHSDQQAIDYGFLTWLLARDGRKESFFGAQPGGNGENRAVSGSLLEQAYRLGEPLAPAVLVPSTNGTYVREFQGGKVVVLPTASGWRNGRIELRG